MVEITTATVATEAERETATSYLWGQTSTGPIVERRYALSDMVFKDVNGKVQLGGTAPIVSEFISVQANQNSAAYNLVSNGNSGASAVAGWYLNTVGNGWGVRTGSTANNSNALEFVLDPFGTPSVKLKIDTTGNVLVTGAGGLGYGTGAGGTITQATSKATPVTLSKACGKIVTNAAALAANTTVLFTVTNTLVVATDVIDAHRASGGTPGAYNIWVDSVAAGSFVIAVRNTTGGSLSEAITINFAITRSVTS